ncbi:hypothetical protein F9817_08345 [Vibrio sp. CAIM 722]|uniref:Polymerase nucleotidyl transferase domain-containing protein n=1 Tax=Vibrio eleionomae TaxID=2653505 RepID=A0A7X4RUK7_9VIBR|nr:nucleotidyltransferase domain-containing protein [Vibrio eleionomae]MZI93204.1 hypothetical protein [Vibrio eleionomae]
MSDNALDLDHLPLQHALVDSVTEAFIHEPDVIAAVLLGSLAAGTGDRVSDADVIVFTQNEFHRCAQEALAKFEQSKDIFYQLEGHHNDLATFKKYIFTDLTSAEIHCADVNEPFLIAKPYQILFDHQGIVEHRLTDEPAPTHDQFEAYTNGDDGLLWELFDCIKWLSRDNHQLTKAYLKQLVNKL